MRVEARVVRALEIFRLAIAAQSDERDAAVLRARPEAPRKLAEWNERKKRKFGRSTEPLPQRVAAMPADSKVVPA